MICGILFPKIVLNSQPAGGAIAGQCEKCWITSLNLAGMCDWNNAGQRFFLSLKGVCKQSFTLIGGVKGKNVKRLIGKCRRGISSSA